MLHLRVLIKILMALLSLETNFKMLMVHLKMIFIMIKLVELLLEGKRVGFLSGHHQKLATYMIRLVMILLIGHTFQIWREELMIRILQVMIVDNLILNRI